jgi:serralysin
MTELALLRAADPKAVLPGIDTPTGNPLAASALKPLSSISTNSIAGFYYNAAENEVVITQAGAVVSGYNFGNATVMVDANNVTIENSSFSPKSVWYSVQIEGHSGTVVKNDTFTGPTYSTSLADFIFSDSAVTIQNNSFINTPSHAINIDGGSGTISGNYFEGQGYEAGAHADAIDVTSTSGPLSITNNFIDWTPTPGAATQLATNAIRITTETGNTSDVTVSGNYLLGAGYTIFANSNTSMQDGTFSNVNIAGNYVGFGAYGAFYPGATSGVSESGNTVFDWTNPAYSVQAWSTHVAARIKTKNLLAATAAAPDITSPATGSTTLYGAGVTDAHLYGYTGGGAGETVFIGGATDYLGGGAGADIFTFLTVSDSTSNSPCKISDFDVNKDVIDLSAIPANLAQLGLTNEKLTFIGAANFTGAGAQVNYVQDAADDKTLVEVALAGDTAPDMVIAIQGLVNLTAANFALTSAQSAADLSAGAALSVKRTVAAGGGFEYAYTNVQGRSYSSFEEMDANSGALVGTQFDNNGGSGTLNLSGNGLTVIEGAGLQSVLTGSNLYSLASHTIEVINAGGATGETFVFAQGFGHDTISGFSARADALQLSESMFSYLHASMSQAQDLAALLSHARASASGLTIADSHGDQLTLLGVTAANLSANAGAVKFV